MCVYMSNVRENYEDSFLHHKEVIFLADKLMLRSQNKICIAFRGSESLTACHPKDVFFVKKYRLT